MQLPVVLAAALQALAVSATVSQDLSAHLFNGHADGGLSNALDFSTLWKRQRWENEDGALLCSDDIPCSDGSCCGSKGTCGYGPDFCGKGNCTSNCDAMAMCGMYGDKTLNKGRCGMGLCCGASGWCGTSDAHCLPVAGVPCQSDYGPCEKKTPRKCGKGTGSSNGRTIGYYQGSNTYSKLCQKVSPAEIDTSKYTHLYYAFASIDPDTFHVQPANEKDIAVYKEFTALKSKGVETWIAVGGFDFSDPGPTHTTWSDLVASADHRAAFIQSLEDFMAQYGFQGVDIDWEYPVDKKRGGTNADTENLVELVKEMHARFAGRYKISMALAPDYWYLRYFDAPAMQPYVDWFGFMTYDLHGFWDGENANLGSVVRGQSQIDEIQNNTAPLYFADLDFSKINFGLANYGRGYTLASPYSCTDLGCPFSGPSKPALCTNEKGVMSITEIKGMIASKKLTPKLLEPQMMKSIQWADQWIGYDDEETVAMKKAWADDYCFGGTMAWSVDYVPAAGAGLDDVKVTTDGTCGRDAMMRCGTSTNKCCSSGGWCGDSEDHCGSGCQDLFGECVSGGNTTDNTCGIQNNDLRCGLSSAGPCCSPSGYCGWSTAHCALKGIGGLDGCQSGCKSWNAQKGVKFPTWEVPKPNMTCIGLKGVDDLTKDLFKEVGTKGEFKKWYNTEENGGLWLSELGKPLGIQRSLQHCTVNAPCQQPNCADMDREGDLEWSGWKYLVIISAVNLNWFFHGMYKSVEEAIDQFNLADASLTSDFFWTSDDNVLLGTYGLTGLAAGIAAVFSLGSPAAAASGAVLSGVVYEAIVALQNQPEVTFEDKLKAFQTIAKAFYDGATKAIKNANIALVQNDGIFAPKGGQKTNALEWLGDGDWVNIKEVPLAIDSKDDTVKTGGDLMYSFVGASIINYAWRKQGVYLACYTMSKDEFKGLKTGMKDELKLYYNGRGCYFQSASPQKGGVWAEPPKGYDKLDNYNFLFSTSDILKSSVDAYKAHGFSADVSKDSKFYDSVASKGKAQDILAAFSIAGVFNLPVCELDTHFETARKFAVHVHPEGETDFPMWCSCFSDKDAHGKTISEIIPQISGQFKKYCRDPKGGTDVGPIGV